MYAPLRYPRPKIFAISISTLNRRFISENGVRNLKTKMRFTISKVAKKNKCRQLTFLALNRIWHTSNVVFFYDETTISQEMPFMRSWFLPGEEAICFVKGSTRCIKLNIVVSFTQIISLSVTEGFFGVDHVSEFLEATVSKLFRNVSNFNHPIWS